MTAETTWGNWILLRCLQVRKRNESSNL